MIWHEEQKKAWMQKGKELGYDVIEEYPINGGMIDVVWLVHNKPIVTIEVENNPSKNQAKYNLLKAMELTPILQIHHFYKKYLLEKYKKDWMNTYLFSSRLIMTDEVLDIGLNPRAFKNMIPKPPTENKMEEHKEDLSTVFDIDKLSEGYRKKKKR